MSCGIILSVLEILYIIVALVLMKFCDVWFDGEIQLIHFRN